MQTGSLTGRFIFIAIKGWVFPVSPNLFRKYYPTAKRTTRMMIRPAFTGALVYRQMQFFL